MKLRSQHPGMVPEFNYLDQPTVSGKTAGNQTSLIKSIAEFVVKLKSMAMPLMDNMLTVSISGTAAVNKVAGIGTQPHGPSFVAQSPLFRQEVDGRIGSLGMKRSRIGLIRVEDMAGKFHHHQRQPPRPP